VIPEVFSSDGHRSSSAYSSVSCQPRFPRRKQSSSSQPLHTYDSDAWEFSLNYSSTRLAPSSPSKLMLNISDQMEPISLLDTDRRNSATNTQLTTRRKRSTRSSPLPIKPSTISFNERLRELRLSSDGSSSGTSEQLEEELGKALCDATAARVRSAAARAQSAADRAAGVDKDEHHLARLADDLAHVRSALAVVATTCDDIAADPRIRAVVVQAVGSVAYAVAGAYTRIDDATHAIDQARADISAAARVFDAIVPDVPVPAQDVAHVVPLDAVGGGCLDRILARLLARPPTRRPISVNI